MPFSALLLAALAFAGEPNAEDFAAVADIDKPATYARKQLASCDDLAYLRSEVERLKPAPNLCPAAEKALELALELSRGAESRCRDQDRETEKELLSRRYCANWASSSVDLDPIVFAIRSSGPPYASGLDDRLHKDVWREEELLNPMKVSPAEASAGIDVRETPCKRFRFVVFLYRGHVSGLVRGHYIRRFEALNLACRQPKTDERELLDVLRRERKPAGNPPSP